MSKLNIMKQLLVVLVLSAIMVLCTGSFCASGSVTSSHCGELTVSGTYTLDDLTEVEVPGESACIVISGDNITLEGTLAGESVGFDGGIKITGDHNVVRGFKGKARPSVPSDPDFGDGALIPLYSEYAKYAIMILGNYNEITDNDIRSSVVADLPGYGIVLDGISEPGNYAYGNEIHHNVFYGEYVFSGGDSPYQSVDQGPSIVLISGARNNSIHDNDFVAFAGGLAFDSETALKTDNHFDSNFWSFTTLEKYGGEQEPAVLDVDLDGLGPGEDKCPYIPFVDTGRDLDGDGIPTWCDDDEFDLNLADIKIMKTGSGLDSWFIDARGVKTDLYMWGVGEKPAENGAGFFIMGDLLKYGLQDPVYAWNGMRLDSILIIPQYFGEDHPSYVPGDIRFGHQGVAMWDFINVTAEDCHGGVVAGPGMNGVAYSYGFNNTCMDYLLNYPTAEGEDPYVEYYLELASTYYDMYINFDTTPVLIDPMDYTSTPLVITNEMGLVFVNSYGEAVRFGQGAIATSGEEVTLDDLAQDGSFNFNDSATDIAEGTNNYEEGILSAIDAIAQYGMPRGADVYVDSARLELTYAPNEGAFDTHRWLVKVRIPESALNEIAATVPDTKEISVTNLITVVETRDGKTGMDGVSLAHEILADYSDNQQFDNVGECPTCWDRPRIVWDQDMWVGSIIPVIGTVMEIKGTPSDPVEVHMVVDEPINLTDGDVVEGALGMFSLGSIVTFENAHFSATDNIYMGFGFGLSDVGMYNSVFEDSAFGFGIIESSVHGQDMTLNTATLGEIESDIVTPEPQDIRAKYVQVCGDELVVQADVGEVHFGLAEDMLSSAIGQDMADALREAVGCGFSLINPTLHAGETGGFLFFAQAAREAARRSTASSAIQGMGLTQADGLTENSKMGVMIVGAAQGGDQPSGVNVVFNNPVLTNTQIGWAVGGDITLTVNGGSTTGLAGDSLYGATAVMSGKDFVERGGFYYPGFADGTSNTILTMNNHAFNDVSTSDYVETKAAIYVVNAEAGDPDAGTGSVTCDGCSATGEGTDIAVEGDDTYVTSDTLPVVPAECTGTAAINAKVTSNDVQANGVPGQQPLAGARVKVFDKVCADSYQDAEDVLNNCDVVSSCLTGADGTCTAKCLTAGHYFALVEHLNYAGKYPSHSVGYVGEFQTKFARFAFLKAPDGKTKPGKTKVQTGSELWIYEPDYVVWDGTEEYYPFVFESPDMSWTVDVCIDAPEGYEPVDGVECVQTIIAGEAKSILFQLVEVGSVPGPMGIEFDMVSPKGKKYHVASEVGMRLSKNLAKAKGVAIDKNGRLLGKGIGHGKGNKVGLTGGAVMDGASGKTIAGVVMLVIFAALVGLLVWLKKKHT